MTGVLGQHGVLLVVVSGVVLLLGIVGGLAALVIIPGNYFSRHRKKPRHAAERNPVWRMVVKIGKNVLGAGLVILGVVMTLPLVPGPGIVFLLLGVSLLDVPGKRRFQRYLISRPMVLKPVNKLRARWGRPKLVTS